MNRCLRLFLCLPLLATSACAADAIAGSELEPTTLRVADPGTGPQLPREARAQASPAVCEGCIVPHPRPGISTIYIVDGLIMSSRPELDAADLLLVEVLLADRIDHMVRADVVQIATRSGYMPRK